MAATHPSSHPTAAAEDFRPEILHMMLWAGFLLLLLAMLAPQFFNVAGASEHVVNRAQWPVTSDISHQL